MKKILGILAAVAILGSLGTGCNNKPPYARLAAAVDSARTAMAGAPTQFADSATVNFDELTNTVKYSLYLPGEVNKDIMDAAADQLEATFVHNLITEDPNMTNCILNDNANIVISFHGADKSSYEIMIENADFKQLTTGN